MEDQRAQFAERTTCISCGSDVLHELASGLYNKGPLCQFIGADPWGEHPAPFLVGKPWSFVKCGACDQAFHRYILTPEWNERRFSKWMTLEAMEAFELDFDTSARRFDVGIANASHVMRIEELTRGHRGDGPVRVLDFGCGYGKFLSMCALFGFDATGVDRSSARRSNGLCPILADIDEIHGNQFHALTLFEVLEHLDEPRPLLQRLATHLVLGGVLILETPNCEGVEDIQSREDYLKIHPLEHINAFTAATLEAFAESLGFTRITPAAAYVTTSLQRVARNCVKRVIGVATGGTQQYFRKTA